MSKVTYYFICRHSTIRYPHGFTFSYDNLNDLIDKALCFMGNPYDKLDKRIASFYKEFDYTGNDYNVYYWDEYYPLNKAKVVPKQFLIMDSNGKIIDIRNYDAIIRKKLSISHESKRYIYTKCVAGTPLYRYRYSWLYNPSAIYLFRRGSVPYVHVYHGRYTPKTHRIQRVRHAEEMRPKNRVDLSNLWDMPPRHTDRSWKSSYKCAHQWEKHLVRRGGKGGVYIGDLETWK